MRLQQFLVKTVIAGVISTSILLSGCGLLSPAKIAPLQTYTISPLHQKPIPAHSKTKLSLLISMPVAYPGFDTSRMAYVQVPYKLHYFANSAWIAPPAQMILPVLADAVRSRGYFYAVVTPPFSGVSNYRLDTQIIMLQQEFLDPVSQIHLIMQANIVNNDTNRVVASQRFESILPAPENNPYNGVVAANAAVSSVSDRIAIFATRFAR